MGYCAHSEYLFYVLVSCEGTRSSTSPLHSTCYRDINRAFQSLSDLSSVKQRDEAPVPVVETMPPQMAPLPQVQEPEAEGVQYLSGSDSDVDEGGAAGRERESALLQPQGVVGHVGGTTGGEPSGDKPPRGDRPPRGLPLKLPFHSLQQQSE